MRISVLYPLLLLALIGADRPAEPPRSPKHLAALLDEFDRTPATEDRTELVRRIDAAAGQKDAVASRLFWYTDLPVALAMAKRENKPVLSLRLLGRLDDELSCANSRFFRKTLYVDPAIASLLRDRFVLHWESLRPVPVVTIDFGNGRQIKRTLTGNSIHYLLAPNGAVIDALPGLYDQATFADELTRIADASATFDSPRQWLTLRHETLERLSHPTTKPPEPKMTMAERAAPIAVAKTFTERPVLRGSRNPSDLVVADTWQNQYRIRPQILNWLMQGGDRDLPALNKRVYAELFLTPLDDPMMGLNIPDEAAVAPASTAISIAK